VVSVDFGQCLASQLARYEENISCLRFAIALIESVPGRMLDRFSRAGYDAASEAYCRIPIDCILTAAKLAYREQNETTTQPTTQQPVLGRSTTPQPVPKSLRIYPEMDLTVQIDDQRDSSRPKKIRITGKADWALAHNKRVDSGAGSVLLAVEATTQYSFGGAECQLLTYLATMQALRRQRYKVNDFVQGFYSDGWLFCFMAIDSDGSVLASKLYHRDHDLHSIFNWVLAMIKTAARSCPTTSPTKPQLQKDAEIRGFRENVLLRFYGPPNIDIDEELEEQVLDDSDAFMAAEDF
jgi:hypothetical protein